MTHPPRQDASGPLPGLDVAEPHEHRWSGVEFFLQDDHPWFRMRCTCGAERTIRAWERYSDPDPVTDEPDGEPGTATEA
jgi:hypothetical protein